MNIEIQELVRAVGHLDAVLSLPHRNESMVLGARRDMEKAARAVVQSAKDSQHTKRGKGHER